MGSRISTVLLLVTLVSLAGCTAAFSAAPIHGLPCEQDDFEIYGLAAYAPLTTDTSVPATWWYWLDGYSAATTSLPNRYTQITSDPDNPPNKVAHVVDIPTSPVDTNYTALMANFVLSGAKTAGVWTPAFDIRVHSGSGAFKAVLTDGTLDWRNGRYWVAAVAFGSPTSNSYLPIDQAQNPNNPSQTLFYEAKSFKQEWVDTTIPYALDTWYTVRFNLDVDHKRYDLLFGPRGGTLAVIASNLPWITVATGTDPPAGSQTSSFGGIWFETSNKANSQGADFMIDNVKITSASPVSVSTVSQAKTAGIGTVITMLAKVVTAGTDQLTGPFCYVQDETGGIRVRTSRTVHQADMISVTGIMDRLSDAGASDWRNGEKEINAWSMVVASGPFPMSHPVSMANRHIGGGPWGLNDSDGYPVQPGVYASGTSPNQVSEIGLSSVGRYCRVFGKVVYANTYDHVLYIDDGSNVLDGSLFPYSSNSWNVPQIGVKVRVKSDVPLSGLVGKYVSLPGIVGANSAAEFGSTSNVNNVRLVRLVEETFTDSNSNGRWDPGESYVDSNENGVWDGLKIEADEPPETADRRFDGAAGPQNLFEPLNWVSANGHYLSMGSDKFRAQIVANGNVLAAYYNVLNDGYGTLSASDKADAIEAYFVKYHMGGSPKWCFLNEISSQSWNGDQTYRNWVKDIVHRLAHTYAHNVALYAPFASGTLVSPADWRALAADCYIVVECYLSGQEIKNAGFSQSWCATQYSNARQIYLNTGVTTDRLFLVEYYSQTLAGSGYGRDGVSLDDWDHAMNVRHAAIHSLSPRYAGFNSYAWSHNDMGVSDDELIHCMETYRAAPLP